MSASAYRDCLATARSMGARTRSVSRCAASCTRGVALRRRARSLPVTSVGVVTHQPRDHPGDVHGIEVEPGWRSHAANIARSCVSTRPATPAFTVIPYAGPLRERQRGRPTQPWRRRTDRPAAGDAVVEGDLGDRVHDAAPSSRAEVRPRGRGVIVPMKFTANTLELISVIDSIAPDTAGPPPRARRCSRRCRAVRTVDRTATGLRRAREASRCHCGRRPPPLLLPLYSATTASATDASRPSTVELRATSPTTTHTPRAASSRDAPARSRGRRR